jgi:uncharacterized protein (TIGR02246 family)
MNRSQNSWALLLVLAGCAQPQPKQAPVPPPPDPAAIRATIETTEKAWSAAYLKGDAPAIANLYTQDAASVPASGEWARGRDAIAKSNQAAFDTVNVTAREDITEEVTVSGDYATEVGHYSWTGTHKKTKAALSGAGRYVVLWHKDADGTWRLHRDLAADVPTPKKK